MHDEHGCGHSENIVSRVCVDRSAEKMGDDDDYYDEYEPMPKQSASRVHVRC